MAKYTALNKRNIAKMGSLQKAKLRKRSLVAEV